MHAATCTGSRRKCLMQAVRDFWDLLKPGGKLHPTYIIEHQGHLVFEVVLTVVIAYLLFQRSYKPSAKQEKPLTEKVRTVCLIGSPFAQDVEGK